MIFRVALCLAMTIAIAGSAWAQTPPIDPAREAREVRVATIMLNNLFDDALAALASEDCARLEKLKAQLTAFSESPSAIAAANGSGPNEISQQKLIELSAMAGARLDALRQPCPRTAAASQPGQGTSAQTAGSGGTQAPPSSLPAKTPVIIITGIDKNGAWLSGDFGHTRTYIETGETTEHNPVIDDDELPPPVIHCSDRRCRMVKPPIKIVAGQEGAKQDQSKQTGATKGGTERTSRGGTENAAKGGTEGATKDGAKPASGIGQAADDTSSKGPAHLAVAMAWLFMDAKPDGAMTQIDPPNLKTDGSKVTIEQGQDRMKVVDAAQALIRDAYTAALDGVVPDTFAIYVIRHAISDAGIALISSQTLGTAVELSPVQLAALKNFGAIRIKDLQLTAPDNSQAGGAKKDGKQPAGSGAAPARTVKKQTPSQSTSAPAQNNELGQQLMQGLIQGGIQYGIGRAMGGGGGDDRGAGSSHQGTTQKVQKTAKPKGTVPASGSAPSGGVMFYGVTGPGR
jgi:hypothetical protein